MELTTATTNTQTSSLITPLRLQSNVLTVVFAVYLVGYTWWRITVVAGMSSEVSVYSY